MLLRNFKMAYVILCHKNPEQINMLIHSLTDENVEFFLHVDKKSNIQHEILHQNNIHFVEQRINVHWGHYSQIECILKCFALIQEHGVFSYIHVISGQDLPLVSNGIIVDFFKENQGKQYVKHVELPNAAEMWGCLYRVSVYYPKFILSRHKRVTALRNRYINLIMSVPKLKRNLSSLPNKLYKGSNWMSITGECMDYILEFTKNNPGYVDFYRHSFCGDEIFFHSIILNSHFKEQVVNEVKRYTDWTSGPEFPRTLTVEDNERIQSKGTECFWGRKFDIEVDRTIIREILQKV
ncbi:N-acetylglucosaminyltransferase [Paenibacillus sp. LC-T2]|uniref:Peptide O-xylosyltransferase n=2 Tax=Paenibacillus monticola TaxID=2666075 RepID=A0A7X2L3N3_9BACL|nr:N-acetylglucosaminyltransferase [Paenibacillus monticola]